MQTLLHSVTPLPLILTGLWQIYLLERPGDETHHAANPQCDLVSAIRFPNCGCNLTLVLSTPCQSDMLQAGLPRHNLGTSEILKEPGQLVCKEFIEPGTVLPSESSNYVRLHRSWQEPTSICGVHVYWLHTVFILKCTYVSAHMQIFQHAVYPDDSNTGLQITFCCFAQRGRNCVAPIV